MSIVCQDIICFPWHITFRMTCDSFGFRTSSCRWYSLRKGPNNLVFLPKGRHEKRPFKHNDPPQNATHLPNCLKCHADKGHDILYLVVLYFSTAQYQWSWVISQLAGAFRLHLVRRSKRRQYLVNHLAGSQVVCLVLCGLFRGFNPLCIRGKPPGGVLPWVTYMGMCGPKPPTIYPDPFPNPPLFTLTRSLNPHLFIPVRSKSTQNLQGLVRSPWIVKLFIFSRKLVI